MRCNLLTLATLVTPVMLLSSYAAGEPFTARLVGFEEVPSAILSPGKGTLELDLNKQARTINFKLTFSGLSAPVTQSHIHFGKRHVAGAITVFFCSNLNNGPVGIQACPAGGGTVSGIITGANVLAIPAQNMPAGDFDALVELLVSHTAYANVHTTNFPAGEIRGQIRAPHKDDEHHGR
jgi:CHRD domain